MRKWHLAIVATLMSAIMSCGGGATGEPTAPKSPTGPGQTPVGGTPSANVTVVTITGQYFTPTEAKVAVGATVSWKWEDCTDAGYGYGNECVAHSVTFDDGSLSSDMQSQGAFNRTFNARGTFTYHCRVHAPMKGQIVVQ